MDVVGWGVGHARGAAGAKYHITWLCTVTGPTVHQLGPVAEWSVFLTGLVRLSVRCRPRAFFFFSPPPGASFGPGSLICHTTWVYLTTHGVGGLIYITAGGDWVIPQGRSGDIYILQWVGAPLPPPPASREVYVLLCCVCNAFNQRDWQRWEEGCHSPGGVPGEWWPSVAGGPGGVFGGWWPCVAGGGGEGPGTLPRPRPSSHVT